MKRSIILACVMIAALCFGCRSTRMWERDAAGQQIMNYWPIISRPLKICLFAGIH